MSDFRRFLGDIIDNGWLMDEIGAPAAKDDRQQADSRAHEMAVALPGIRVSRKHNK